MTRHRVTITPRTSLFVGGYTASDGQSTGDTARDGRGFLVPGSVLKGALRESALRLVRGAEIDEEILVTLFGDEYQLRAGKLRLGPLYAGDACAQPSLRHHVTLDRATRQAADKRLFQNRVTPAGLRFEGVLEMLEELTDDESALLRSAVEITAQVGGGRGRGLGLVTVELSDKAVETAGGPETDHEKAVEGPEAILVLEAREPLQLGAVKDLSNIEPTGEVLDGSAVRGAVAAMLARIVEESERDEVLELVLGGEAPVVFGSGFPSGAEAVPAPRTLQVPKGAGAAADRAVALCLEVLGVGAGSGTKKGDMKSAKGTWVRCHERWGRFRVPLRTITRTARNPIDGRASSGQLFSIQVVDPVPEGGAEKALLRFYVPVKGTPAQLGWVVRAAGRGLLVGGTRSRGFGRVELVAVEQPTLAELAGRHARWVASLCERGAEAARARATGVLLALGPVALSPPRLEDALARHRLRLIGGDARRDLHGGWNTRRKLPRTILGCYAAGSTFLVATMDESSALPRLESLEQKGLGPGRPDGWGRLVACHPIHLDCCEKES